MSMSRRQRMCEKRQSRRRAKIAPPPPTHTCLTPDEYAEQQRQQRLKRVFGHVPHAPPPIRTYVILDDDNPYGTTPTEGD